MYVDLDIQILYIDTAISNISATEHIYILTKKRWFLHYFYVYRPFFFAGVALMLHLEVLKWSFIEETVFQDNIQVQKYLAKAIDMVSHRTLPFSHGVHENSTSMMEFANITKVVSRSGKK